MKLPKSAQIKETVKLFENKYNYKVVLVSPCATWFRNKKFYQLINYIGPSSESEDFKYAYTLAKHLSSLGTATFSIRVEYPKISIYTDDPKQVEAICAIDEARIKQVYLPSKTLQKIEPGTIVLKTLDFDYKVHVGTIKKRNHREFIQWAEGNKNIRITGSCKTDLSRDYSWGGSYFYVKGAKTLTMVKMFLGSDIARIENVIKA